MADAPRGMLDLEALERGVDDGSIETVVTALPDPYGRLIGKRITGRFFLDHIAGHGMHLCNYLLACDMEMDPTPGYAFTSWEQGYSDVRAIPDLATLRVGAWLDKTVLVLCDAAEEETDDLIEVAPRTVLRRQVERATELGIVPQMASELEFFLFHDDYATAQFAAAHPGEPQRDTLVTATALPPDAHIAMQAALQSYVDNAISKTVNVAADLPFDAFGGLYRSAWRAGLKGCTAFRPNPVTGSVVASADADSAGVQCCDIEREAD